MEFRTVSQNIARITNLSGQNVRNNIFDARISGKIELRQKYITFIIRHLKKIVKHGLDQWFSTQIALRPVFLYIFFHDPQLRTFKSISCNYVT